MEGVWTVRAVERSVLVLMADRRQGGRIAELRERRGLSQEEVARRVGVSTSGYQKWELGGGIRGQNLRRLAEVLDVSLVSITGEADPPDPFSLAEHLDARTEEFRQYTDEMRGLMLGVTTQLDRVTGLLEEIAAGMRAPTEPAALIAEGGSQLERAARTRRAGRAAPGSGRAARGERGEGR